MINCPTANVNSSRLWGFEVVHIIASFSVLAVANVLLTAFSFPLWISWLAGVGTLLSLKVVSFGKKDGHLELAWMFITGTHQFLGHKFTLEAA